MQFITNRPRAIIKIKNHYDSSVVVKPKNITENGSYNSKEENADGYNPITVNVPTFEEENSQLIVQNQQLQENVNELTEEVEEKTQKNTQLQQESAQLQNQVGELTETIEAKDTQIAELEQDVEEAFDNGKQAEYDAFWDNYQNNGTRQNYSYAFYGSGWNDDIFNPKYEITPTYVYANHMFSYSKLVKPDLSKIDFSKCPSVINLFYSCSVLEELGILDFSSVVEGYNGLQQTLNECTKLRKIEKIIMPKTVIVNRAFTNCTSLTEIRFEGVLGKNQNFQWCPFSVESMKSIISCLKNYSGTSEEYAYKLTFKPECWDALEADSTAPDGGKWVDYVDSLGWTT